MNDLKGKTLFITGASRGIGKAIALRAAEHGANIVIAAKTAEPHPKLPGTIYYDSGFAQAGNHGGRGPRDLNPTYPRVHRQLFC
jgi:NAD(P)-dependent dehydrogenase (short-subunit alcohol dehydrogenase family)